MSREVASDYPFESRFIDVLDSTIHYIEVGTGNPILLLHGNPTWSYLWRNIIPHLGGSGRVIAVDLIGMGRSGKPDCDYRFSDHARYLAAFIDKLNLESITLVLHDWGSVLGFDYARRNSERISSIVFMEANVKPRYSWNEFDEGGKNLFAALRDPVSGYHLTVEENIFIEKMLPGATMRKLTESEMEFYREPFRNDYDRKPLMQWPRELPIAGEPEDVFRLVEEYSLWLQKSSLPKLLLYVTPGAIMGKEVVSWCEENLANLKSVNVGVGIHFIQEDCPNEIGIAIKTWICDLNLTSNLHKV